MHLKEQYNKPLMVDIGWISTQTRFFQDKTGFLIFTDSYIKVSKFKTLNDFKYNLMTMVSGRRGTSSALVGGSIPPENSCLKQ